MRTIWPYAVCSSYLQIYGNDWNVAGRCLLHATVRHDNIGAYEGEGIGKKRLIRAIRHDVGLYQEALESEAYISRSLSRTFAATAEDGKRRRSVRSIGVYAARFANTNPDLLPICVKAGALADGVPSRDLRVSRKHALLLDGVLIPAAALVNGVSVVKAERVADVLTYWHVELEGGHGVLLAENTPAESFVDDNGRGIFHNARTFHALYPDAVEAEAVYCAPRVEGGHVVAAVRGRLAQRAGIAGALRMPFGALRGHVDRCDGRTLTGWAQDALYPEAPVCLDVVVDGEVVTMIYAEAYRRDLAAAGFGDGLHGFSLSLPLAAETGHTVEVRRSADGVALSGSPWLVAPGSARAA